MSSGRILVLLIALELPCISQAQVTVQATVELRAQGGKKASDHSNVVMWLTPADAPVPPASPKKQYAITQRNKSFSPHVLAVPVGTRVAFPNKDPFFHNVFSLYQGKRFDLGLYEAGSSREVLFDKPGVSFIFCNIHPNMSAYVLALQTPFFAISDKQGKVLISGIPPGTYRLHVWYERAETEDLEKLSRTISVNDTDLRLGTIEIQESANFKPSHPNKHGQEYDPELSPY